MTIKKTRSLWSYSPNQVLYDDKEDAFFMVIQHQILRYQMLPLHHCSNVIYDKTPYLNISN